MVNIHYPVGQLRWVQLQPLGTLIVSELASIKYDTPSRFDESPGMYGQNNVHHTKFSGDIMIDPYSSYTRRFTSTVRGFPYRIPVSTVRGNSSVLHSNLPTQSMSFSRLGTGAWKTKEFVTLSNGVYDILVLVSHGRVHRTTYTSWIFKPGDQSGAYIRTRMEARAREGFESDLPLADVTSAQLEQFLASSDVEITYTDRETSVYWYRDHSTMIPSMNLRSIGMKLDVALARLSSRTPPVLDRTDGDLVMIAANKRFSIQENFIESALGYFQLKSLIKTFTKKISHLRDVPKDFANKFLAYSYGVRPMENDLKAIIDAIERIPHRDSAGYRSENSAVASYGEFSSRIRRVHLALRGPDASVTNPFRNAGFALTPKNIWETIPYSFVLDWFVDVASFLDDIQTHSDFVSLPVAYSMISDKFVTYLDISDEDCTGRITLSDYSRSVSEKPPQPNYIGSSMASPSAHKNWLEGSALIMSAKR